MGEYAEERINRYSDPEPWRNKRRSRAPMAAPRKTKAPAKFEPTIMFTPTTEADRHAVRLVHSLYEDIKGVMNTERNQQREIGISEIDDECVKCIARQLSGIEFPQRPPNWKAQMGTFGHAGLEEHFGKLYPVPTGPATDANPHYLLEEKVSLHQYKGLDLGGHCDLFIQGETFGIVDDWKFLGENTLTKEPSQKYITQMSGYGLAFERAGRLVTHTILYRLPRVGDIEEASPVLARYDRSHAIKALARLEQLIDAAELVGWEAVIDAQPQAGFCFNCNFLDRDDSGEEAFLAAFR